MIELRGLFKFYLRVRVYIIYIWFLVVDLWKGLKKGEESFKFEVRGLGRNFCFVS